MVFTFLVYVAVNVFNVSCAFSFVNTNNQLFLTFFCSMKSPLFKRTPKRGQRALKRQNTATLAASFVVGVSALNVFAIAANG